MKYLAMTTAALFLLAAPGMALAQSSTGGNNNGGSNSNAGSGTTTGTNGNSDQASNKKSQCSDETSTSSYDSFSEKCRHEIDAWAASQSGKPATFKGDVVVGAVVPDDVEIVEVPSYKSYGYVMLGEHRVLVDRHTHKIVRVY